MSLQSPLGRVLGKGSAKSGFHHWWVERVSAAALVPLGLWFAFSLAALPDLSLDTVRSFAAVPGHAVLLALFAGTATYHSRLGLQVVVEDYVHAKGAKLVTLLLLNFIHAVLGAAMLLAVVRLSLGGAA
ncbi:MAG: succinate dehydrogenase, hydrophobic membrane anchor protein [Gammaproteobacteria bacterium]